MPDITLYTEQTAETRRIVWRIVLVGGSGQVGGVLARHFHASGDDVTVITRSPTMARWKSAQWNGETLGDWMRTIDGADVVINLAGRSVNCRYGIRNRAEILNSRVKTTSLVGSAIAAAEIPPSLWLNASTASIYRHALDRAMDERTGELGGNEVGAPDSWNFSIEVAKKWEESFFAATVPRTRKIALRSAMTMSPDPGGIFDVLLRLTRFGLGGKSASGAQYISWIHERDFIRAIEFLIANASLGGVVNLAAPNPVPNAEFMKILRQAWGMRVGLPATKWMLELGAFFLQTETELILKSRRVVPRRLLDAGFEFLFPAWREAAEDLVRQWREKRSKGDLR